ncbi:MAG: SxtJ family membrane protein [Planctomycetota bacterium]|jgi:hypothetical protein
MIIEEIKNIASGKSELRKFGITVGTFLGLLGGLFLWREKEYYFYFLIFSAALLFLGTVAPILLRPIHKVWMILAVLLGWVMTRIILSVLFYLVVTPIGLLAKLFGKSRLNLAFDKSAESYWRFKDNTRQETSDYEKQF